jgi:polygalacturonase
MKIKLFSTLAVLVSALSFGAFAQDIPLPQIPDKIFNITDYGAVGDGKTLNTAAIQKAVDAASAAGGGKVLVPAGNFLTGPFTLASSVNFHLAKNAVILISDDRATYPIVKARYVDSITAKDAHDLKISGEGTIDGQGESWWNAFRADAHMTHRPYLIKLTNCQRVEVEGVTLQNSPMFHLVPQGCTDVTIRGVTIHSPGNAPNTDGIDPSGWNFLITHCTIDTGDDNIAIKPNGDRQPGNKNYLVTDCHFLRGHGMSVGGGSAGGLDNLTVSNCTFVGTDSGIRIKTLRGNGGLLQNATYENLTMDSVKNPIYIIDWYPERTAPKDLATEKPEPITDKTPFNKNIVIRNVTITNSPNAGTIRGLPEAPITDVLLSNVNISAETGMKIYFATGIKFVDSKITAQSGANVTTFSASVEGLEMAK